MTLRRHLTRNRQHHCQFSLAIQPFVDVAKDLL